MEITFKKDSDKKKFNFKDWLKKVFDPRGVLCFYLFLCVIGILFFITSLSWNNFTTPFGGDYCAQQISFYTHGYDTWREFFRTGHFALFDTETFLGASAIGANAFYYLFDPFFMLILVWPRTYIAQGMAAITIVKIATGGLFLYLYMQYMGASKTASKISAFAYCFCGWMSWYLWFNHMTEIMTLLPLMLWGVEVILKEKKPWLLMFAIFAMGITNYYFCITMTICAFFYAMFRWIQLIPTRRAKENFRVILCGVVGFALGCMLACVILLPTCLYALNTSRGTSSYLGDLKNALVGKDFNTFFGLIFDWSKVDYYYKTGYRSFYAVIEYIFPATTNRNLPTIRINSDSYEPEACSLFCYIPIMIFFVPALIRSIRQRHYSPLIATALFCVALSTPFTYYMMHGFSQPYSRWTLFATSSLVAYVGLYLDKIKEEPKWMVFVGGASLEILLALGCIFSYMMVNSTGGVNFNERVPIWLVTLIEAIYISIVAVVLFLILNFKKKYLNYFITGFITIEACLMGAFVIEGHGVATYQDVNNGWYNNEVLSKLTKATKQKDSSYYRSYSSLATTSAENDGMRNNYNGLSFFHSLYNFNIDDFCDWSRIKGYGSWSGIYCGKRLDMDTFLGIKYYYVQESKIRCTEDKSLLVNQYGANVPFTYKDVTSEYQNNDYRVYENTEHVNFGAAYSQYYKTQEVTESGRHYLSGSNEVEKENKYTSGAIIFAEDEEFVLSENPNLLSLDDGNYSSIWKPSNFRQNCDVTYYDIYNRADQSQTKEGYNLSLSTLLDINESSSEFSHQTSHPSSDEHWGRWVEIIKPKSGYSFSYDPDGVVVTLSSYYTDENKYDIDVYLVSTDNKLICTDDHQDRYQGGINYNYLHRSFYSSPTRNSDGSSNHDAPEIDRIIICPRNSETFTPNDVYVDTYSNYKNRLSYESSLEDVVYKDDHITFKTNYSEKKIVVTQMTYEEGWKVVAHQGGKNIERKVFKVQGGFAGFISLDGEATYDMTFFTPHLKTGGLISLAGLFGFIATYGGYHLYIYKKKKKVIVENN